MNKHSKGWAVINQNASKEYRYAVTSFLGLGIAAASWFFVFIAFS